LASFENGTKGDWRESIRDPLHTAMATAFLKPDRTRLSLCSNNFLRNGAMGIVLKQGDYALKSTKVRDTSSMSPEERDSEEFVSDSNRLVLELEKAVYWRLGRHDGIADCIRDIGRRHSAGSLQARRSWDIH
jgi:hypothetical protein